MTIYHNNHRGLTLIELIASLTVFLIVMATLVVAVNTSLDTWRRSRERARQIITGRAALDLIVDDLQHAVANSNTPFRLIVIPNGIHRTTESQANCTTFYRLAPNPAANGMSANGDVLWHVQPTNTLGALIREFSFTSGAPSNRIILAEGVATLQFVPLGLDVNSNATPAELSSPSLPPIIDVYLELLSPADGRRAQGMTQPDRDVFIARKAVHIATRVAFSACQLPPQDKPSSYLCSGKITDAAGNGLNGVQINFFGTSTNSTKSTADGSYAFNVPSWWPVYTINPLPPPNAGTGAYDPQQRVCRLSQGVLEGQDFRWIPSDHTISGLVTRDGTGVGVPGVRIAFPNTGETETDGTGYYAIGINDGWPYDGTVYATPTHPHGGTFNPTSISYSDVRADWTGQNYIWTPPMLVISGYITWAAANIGVLDALISFNGVDAPPPVITTTNGYYCQTVPYEWTGLVTPQLSTNANTGGFFDPLNANFISLTHDIRQDFTWYQWSVAISGHVYYGDSALGISNAIIHFNNSGPTVTSSADGSYVAYVPLQWSGISTPFYSEYGAFNPPQRSYNTISNSVADEDYRWYAYKFLIAGRVTETNTLRAVTNAMIHFITTNGFAAATDVFANANGYYTNAVSAGWSGVTIPTSPLGGTFDPPSNTYSNVTNNWLNENFLWTSPYKFLIAGRVTETNTLQAMTNAVIHFITTNGLAAVTYISVNTNGYYTNAVSAGWSGVTIPTYPTNGMFAPLAYTYTNVMTDWPTQNFKWIAE